jgi:hypothetical protein
MEKLMPTVLFKHDKFKEVCEKIESHFSFRKQMTELESLNTARKIQNNTMFITSCEFKYQESDGRQGKVYQILKTEWDYDCFPYNASNMYPYPNNNEVLLVHADGTCTTHTKDYKTQQIDFSNGSDSVSPAKAFDLDNFLKAIPEIKQPKIEAEQTTQISKTI